MVVDGNLVRIRKRRALLESKPCTSRRSQHPWGLCCPPHLVSVAPGAAGDVFAVSLTMPSNPFECHSARLGSQALNARHVLAFSSHRQSPPGTVGCCILLLPWVLTLAGNPGKASSAGAALKSRSLAATAIICRRSPLYCCITLHSCTSCSLPVTASCR